MKKESEHDRAMLALTSTLNKLIKRLEEKQIPDEVKKHRRRKLVPKKPPPSPQPAGKHCQPGRRVSLLLSLQECLQGTLSEISHSLSSFWNSVLTPAFSLWPYSLAWLPFLEDILSIGLAGSLAEPLSQCKWEIGRVIETTAVSPNVPKMHIHGGSSLWTVRT